MPHFWLAGPADTPTSTSRAPWLLVGPHGVGGAEVEEEPGGATAAAASMPDVLLQLTWLPPRRHFVGAVYRTADWTRTGRSVCETAWTDGGPAALTRWGCVSPPERLDEGAARRAAGGDRGGAGARAATTSVHAKVWQY